MQFKIDENLPVDVAEILRGAGHDVLTIADQQMSGDGDPRVAAVCRSEKRALVTLDLDFADIRTYPPGDFPGIVVVRPRSQSKAAVMSLIARMLPLLDTEQLSGNLWILQENGVRIREGQ